MRQASRYLTLNDLVALLPWVPAGSVLDAGCGPGQLAVAVARYGLPVEAIDVDSDQIDVLKKKHPHIIWKTQDIRHYPLKRNHYAAIFCQNLLPFIPDQERPRLIGRLKAALKPGGIMVMTGFNTDDPSVDTTTFAQSMDGQQNQPTGILEYGELLQRFKSWDIRHVFEGQVQDNHPPHGSHVHGLSQIVARKPLVFSEGIDWAKLPHLGAGMGWRSALAKQLRQPGAVDFLEVMLDDYLEPGYDSHLAHLVRQFPVVAHGVEISIGSVDGIDRQYLEDVGRVVARCGGPWWSDHLCFTRTPGHKTFALNPLPATEEALETVKRNIKQVQAVIPTPLLLENVAYYVRPNHAEMDDATFLSRVSKEADCGILLDVANLYGNTRNLNLDAKAFIDGLPLERVVQLHLAGGNMMRGMLFDTHDHPVWKETWDLLKYVLKRCDIRAISIERDAIYDTPDELIEEVAKARRMMGWRLS